MGRGRADGNLLAGDFEPCLVRFRGTGRSGSICATHFLLAVVQGRDGRDDRPDSNWPDGVLLLRGTPEVILADAPGVHCDARSAGARTGSGAAWDRTGANAAVAARQAIATTRRSTTSCSIDGVEAPSSAKLAGTYPGPRWVWHAVCRGEERVVLLNGVPRGVAAGGRSDQREVDRAADEEDRPGRAAGRRTVLGSSVSWNRYRARRRQPGGGELGDLVPGQQPREVGAARSAAWSEPERAPAAVLALPRAERGARGGAPRSRRISRWSSARPGALRDSARAPRSARGSGRRALPRA